MDRKYGHGGTYKKTLENGKCPHLIKWLTSICRAVDKHYTPSSFQVQEYCRTKNHLKCPFYARTKEYEVQTL